MAVTDVRVYLGLGSAPDDPSQMWTDVTAYVRMADGISITRGRSDEQSNIEPGRLSLTLNNADGRFTWGFSGGACYPNILPRKRIRVRVYEGDWWSDRFDGYVDGWPASFAGVSEQPRVRITATDRLARLGRSRLLRHALHEEWGAASYSTDGWILDDATYSVLDSTTVLSGGLQWLYGLQESSGSTTAGDVSGAQGRPTLTTQQIGAEGTLEFGAAGILPEGTAAQFSPASAGNGVTLTKAGGPVSYVGGEFTLACQFAWTGTTGAQLVQVGASPSGRIALAVTPTTVVATFASPAGGTATATKTVATGDNRPHHALLTVSGGTAYLHVDQMAAATTTPPADMGSAQGLTIGGTTSADVHQVAWVAYSNVSVSVARAQELGMIGSGDAEMSGARVARLLRWLNIPTADQWIMAGQSQVSYQASGDAQALDLINEVCKVEGGRFWARGHGVFDFYDRSYDGSSPFSFGADVSRVDPGEFEVVVDTSDLVNDITVSRPAGATFRMRDEASIEAYGEFSAAATYYAASDDALRDLAAVRLSRYSQPVPRVPSVKVNLLTDPWWYGRQVAMLVDLGTRINVYGLDAATTPGGVTDMDLIVEGVREDISPTTHTLAFTTSPAWGDLPWLLDDAARSQLDDTTVLGY